MRFKNILTYFCTSTAVAAVLRIYQVFYTVDPSTGFFKSDFYLYGSILFAAIAIILISLAAVSLTVHRCPIKMRHIDGITGVFSLLMALGVFYDTFSAQNMQSIPLWQYSALLIFGILTGLFFVLLTVKSIKKFNIPPIAFIIPVIYYIVKLIYLFTAISYITLISDNIFILATNVFILLFMFEMSKLANGIDTKNGYKKLLLSGLLASSLCFIYGIAQLLYTLSGISQNQSIVSAVSALLTGLFIYRFIRIHFSMHNLKRSHNDPNVVYMSGKEENDFYTG